MSEKDDRETEEENWLKLGHRCIVCSQPIPLSERDVYFKTNRCLVCDNVQKKDD